MGGEYSKRTIADLRLIAAHYARSGDPATAARIAERIQEIVGRIAVSPLSGRPVVQRPGVLVAPLPSLLLDFLRGMGDIIRIVHFRHTSRRPYD